MSKSKEIPAEPPTPPEDLITKAENTDPESGKAVVALVLEAYERGFQAGVKSVPVKKGFWE